MRVQKSASSMRSASLSSLQTTKMLLLSLALFPLSAIFLQGASAFVTPSIGSKGALACNTNHQIPHHNNFGTCTKLWAETPKSTNKGSAAKSETRKTKGTKKKTQKKKQAPNKKPIEISAQSLSPSQKMESINDEENREPDEMDQNYGFNIPKTGYSLADQLENKSAENRERFETTLTPIVVGICDDTGGKTEGEVKFQYDDDGFPIGVEEVAQEDNEEEDDSLGRHQGVARIDTISTQGNVGEEPVRWLVSLGDTKDDNDNDHQESYAMVDLPPYSDKLADEIRSFMDPEYNNATDASEAKAKATVDVILLTNQQCIHYDSSPAVYVTRKSDLKKWKKAFPSAEVIMYRLDIPRECRDEVTQILDGYGPWGWDEEEQGGEAVDGQQRGKKFMETGRPLTIEEWDDDTKSKVLSQGELPPDDQEVENDGVKTNGDDDDGDDSLYSPEAIRQREENYRLLAVYTPGHTFGSVTYIFPHRGICCSGYTLPLESSGNTASEDDYYDDFDEDDYVTGTAAVPPQGPRLDYQGYLATSASRPRQMSSALSLINNYIDRFRVVLPARGDVVFLNSEKETRKREIMESVGLYQKIGDIYGRLGIVE